MDEDRLKIMKHAYYKRVSFYLYLIPVFAMFEWSLKIGAYLFLELIILNLTAKNVANPADNINTPIISDVFEDSSPVFGRVVEVTAAAVLVGVADVVEVTLTELSSALVVDGDGDIVEVFIQGGVVFTQGGVVLLQGGVVWLSKSSISGTFGKL